MFREEMTTTQSLEAPSIAKRDSQVLSLWRNFQHSDLYLAKTTHIYILIWTMIFLGSIFFVVVGNINAHYFSNLQEFPISFQGLLSSRPNDSLKRHANTMEEMDMSTQIQRAVIIDVDTSPLPTLLQDKNAMKYQNMSATWHYMGDEELRQTASKTSPKPRGLKIAFMFISKGPMPFAPLWERYFHGHDKQYSIYIHAHPTYIPSFNTTSPFFGRFIPSKVVEWGKVSLQEAEDRLLFNALLDDSNSWFVLLSESCIPVENFSYTYKHIMESKQSFIMSFQESKKLEGTRLKMGKHWEMAPEVVVDNFRKGSQWFQINRDLAHLVSNDTTYYKKFVNSFCQPHPVCYLDEHYLPTLFSILRPKAIASRTLTYFEFPHHGPHPTKWDMTNTNAKLVKSIREGHTCSYNGQLTNRCFLFARKFDPNALPILLDFANKTMGIP